MTDLKKINTPFMFCTEEEQIGLEALIDVSDALQIMGAKGDWFPRRGGTELLKGCVYRQNPDWNQPTLYVPAWIWKNTIFNFMTVDEGRNYWLHICKPQKFDSGFQPTGPAEILHTYAYKIDFNPHNVPWEQSLTERPQEYKDG